MRSRFEQFALEKIRSGSLLRAGDRVAVAVSGGADSIALLRLLHTLQAELGIVLSVAHFNHALRAAESDADEKFVADLAQHLDIPFIAETHDVRSHAQQTRGNLEEAGRTLRYAFFDRIVTAGKATRVAVAHTADDQAETVLAQIVRGTGPTGLAGIFPQSGTVVRPLLEIRRVQLREYLRELQQRWREDASNADTTRLRAKIRASLLPLLATEFSPAIVEHLSTLSTLAREESQFWNALTEQRFTALASPVENGTLKIATADLLHPLQPQTPHTIHAASANASAVNPFRALTERLTRRLYQGIRGDLRQLTAAHVEQVIHLADKGVSGRRVELPGHIVAERTFDSIVFSKKAPAAADGTIAARRSYSYQVARPAADEATVSVPELGTAFRLKVIDWSQRESDTKRDTVALDADLLHFPLVLRNWRPGDAYRPKGRRDERKLNQLLLASRVPAAARATWPVLESGGKIVWAQHMPVSADFLVSPATQVGLVIEDARFSDDTRN